MVANNARRPMTPEAPKRSLDAPSEAAHREQLDALSRLHEVIASYNLTHDSGVPRGPLQTGRISRRFVLDRIEDEMNNLIGALAVQPVEREAAHPSGAGSSSNEYAGITNYPTPGDDER